MPRGWPGGRGAGTTLAGMLRRLLLRLYRLPERADELLPRDLGSMAEEVVITAVDGALLRGWYLSGVRTDQEPGPAVLVMHGWSSSGGDMLPAARAIGEAGLRTLVIDARGHGRSDRVDHMSMPRFAEDVDAAVAWLRVRPDVDRGRIALVGHSVGAGACLLAASRDPRIAGVVSVASMAHPREMIGRSFGRYRVPKPLVRRALRTIERTIGHAFDDFAPLHTIGRIDAPVLIVHGLEDRTVSAADAVRLADAGGPDTALQLVPGADHRRLDGFAPTFPDIIRFLRTSLSAGQEDDRASVR